MMRFRLIWVGKESRKSPEHALCERYVSRIGKYGPIEEKVIRPLTGAAFSLDEIQKRESQKIIDLLEPGDFVVLCDERGRGLSSKGLADIIDTQQTSGIRRITWVIGGAMGVATELRHKAGFVLSLSQMTLPHALARVMLLEQLYRALCINSGHPYHHEG